MYTYMQCVCKREYLSLQGSLGGQNIRKEQAPHRTSFHCDCIGQKLKNWSFLCIFSRDFSHEA